MRLWSKKEEPLDPEAVKARSRTEVERLGGRSIDWLPVIEQTRPRDAEALAGRALVLNALVGYAYEAPASMLREWIAANGLTPSLSTNEAALLRKETEELTEQERNDVSWSPEAIAALLWAGGLLGRLALDEEVSMDVFRHLPTVGRGEGGAGFRRKVRLRPYAELYAMRDFYYRAHWFARDGGLNGYDTGVFLEGAIMERRKALEWVMDETSDWDDVEMST